MLRLDTFAYVNRTAEILRMSSSHLDQQHKAHSEHQELVEGANKDLRFQLLRLIALAFHEELLDAQMSDMAISGVLLLCTHDGHFDHMLRTHLPLEALAALVSHR